jgi:hypothetical protein
LLTAYDFPRLEWEILEKVMKTFGLALGLSCAPGLAMAALVPASEPVGVYALVDRVVLEPDGNDPQRIQIWGDFMFAFPKHLRDWEVKQPPVNGLLYFTIVKGKEEVCRSEWSDLQKMAGTGICVALGGRYNPVDVRVREKPERADPYPLNIGLVKMHDRNEISRKLRSIAAPSSPARGDQVAPGKVTLEARNAYNADLKDPKYHFEIESGGKKEASDPLPPGDKVTRWTPKLEIEPEAKYVWRVHVTDGDWKGPISTATFTGKSIR